MIKISVVIPTYKRPDLLLVCLAHLEAQTLSKGEFEVLVVSDGFDESTRTAVSGFMEYSPMHIVLLHTEGKQGPAAARNIGWQHAAAPLIAFTDDDCRPEPSWLIAFLDHYADGFKAFSGFTRVPMPRQLSDFALNTFHLQTAAFITANCACARILLEEVGGFDERFKAAWREDSDLEFKLNSKGVAVLKIGGAVVIHPVRTAPWGISIREQKKGQYNALLYKKFPAFYRERIQAFPPLSYYAVVSLFALIVVSYVMHWYAVGIIAFVLMNAFVLRFFYRRLIPLPKSGAHIWEMLLTSWVIPFVAVYWRVYGAVKFRVVFL